VDGLEVDHERAAEAVSDPALLATDAAEELVREGVPFRDAYERVAEAVRGNRFEPPHDAEDSVAARSAPGPGGVAEALAAARARFDNT
jgi:argininosuccinate lyase